MSSSDARESVYELFYNNHCSLIDLLNNSSCDEIVEVDLKNDIYKQFYHVKGKYLVPDVDISYKDLFKFTKEHIVHPEDKEIYDKLMNPKGFFTRLKKNKIPNFDFAHFRYKLQGGEYRYVEQCVIAGEENGLGDGVFRIYILDIHNLMIRELGGIGADEHANTEVRDSTTGLLEVKSFQAEARKRVDAKKSTNWCLISIDIEHFKFFDEWYGRETGDYLLAQIGAILLENEKPMNGLAGYFGQDDFIFLCRYSKKKIEELYEKIRELIISFGFSMGFMPAFGIAILERNMLILDAFDRASIAASEAKKDIRNRICVYNPDMQLQSENEYRIITEYMKAYKNDEITFYLQPQCRISTRKIVGAESLARWIKPDGTIVPPNEYIPILEKFGFITDLDQRLWEKVCVWLRKMLDEGRHVVPISLNVSRTDIFTIDIYQYFVDLTAKYNIPHDLIKLEITESAYTESTAPIAELVKKLRKDGFLVLMDDFGSGYSSLNMLSNIKVDAIKLDARFLQVQGPDLEKGIHILESVINMSKQIAIPIIVEGVENQKQCDFLEGFGCRYVQGFYFYRPMPIDKFEKIIASDKIIDKDGFVVKLNEQFRIREFLDKNIYSDSMLNSIIGAVALYQIREGKHVDIIRFNQQFYESVNVPDFQQRLVNIERFLPDEDKPKIIDVLKRAKNNKIGGASEVLRFYKTDGTLSCYNMKYFYLGKKEGGDRFYGSATKVTELVDLQEERELISKYSKDNFIFVRKKAEGKWEYSVVSHGLSDELGLSPIELEKEMNSGEFANRVINRAELSEFMESVLIKTQKKVDFSTEFYLRNKCGKPIKVHLDFTCVSGKYNNVEYLLQTTVIAK